MGHANGSSRHFSQWIGLLLSEIRVGKLAVISEMERLARWFLDVGRPEIVCESFLPTAGHVRPVPDGEESVFLSVKTTDCSTVLNTAFELLSPL